MQNKKIKLPHSEYRNFEQATNEDLPSFMTTPIKRSYGNTQHKTIYQKITLFQRLQLLFLVYGFGFMAYQVLLAWIGG